MTVGMSSLPAFSLEKFRSSPLVLGLLVAAVLMTDVFICCDAKCQEGRFSLGGLGGMHKFYIRWTLPPRDKDTSFPKNLMNTSPSILKEDLNNWSITSCARKCWSGCGRAGISG